MGMYGIFRVDPKGYEPADKEYFFTLKDWDSRVNRQMAGEDVDYSPRNRSPDVFTMNGKSLPRTLHPEEGSPIIVDHGDTVRLHMVNAGYMSHPMHTHNHRFRLVEKTAGRSPKRPSTNRTSPISHPQNDTPSSSRPTPTPASTSCTATRSTTR